jgi:hypothetical protein
MYIEDKSSGLTGPARIGRVTFSKTGKTVYYQGRAFRSLKGQGFKSNFYEVGTGAHFWISGPRKDGLDALYGGRQPVAIDPDVHDEYWREIRVWSRVAAARVRHGVTSARHANNGWCR